MPKLYFLIGNYGSGKSTWAKQNINNNTIIISQNDIRNQFNSSENSTSILKKIIEEITLALNNNKNVIYDSININTKERRNFLSLLSGIECEKIAVYFATYILDCMGNNLNRENYVDEEILELTYKNLKIPMYHEGWDKIEIVGQYSTNYSFKLSDITDYDSYEYFLDKSITNSCIDFPQDNKYHTLSLSRHMYYTYEYLKNKDISNNLKIAALLHDIGKVDCKTFKENSRYANFYCHENVSAQLAIIYLLKTGMEVDSIVEIATYIQLHQRLTSIIDNDKAKNRFKKLVGDNIYNNLLEFYNADSQAK